MLEPNKCSSTNLLMGSSPRPPPPPSSLPHHHNKKPYSFTPLSLLFFLLLLLISIFFFSQNALENTISSYKKDLLIWSPSTLVINKKNNPSFFSPLPRTNQGDLDNGVQSNELLVNENITTTSETNPIDSISNPENENTKGVLSIDDNGVQSNDLPVQETITTTSETNPNNENTKGVFSIGDNGLQSIDLPFQKTISTASETNPIDSISNPNTKGVDDSIDENGVESNDIFNEEAITTTSETNLIDSISIDDNGVQSNDLPNQENSSEASETNPNDSISDPNSEGGDSIELEKVNLDTKCDLYTGKWVKDDEYPIYQPGSCPYVDEAYDCQNNGRRDSDYMKWRWKPDGCDLPRFNATDFLERLRGKKLMLIGDSMNRNQFESILCLLREGLPDKSKMYEVHGYKITKGRGYYIFKFEDYNCSVDFVRSHFLVKEGIRLNAKGQSNPTLSIDRIDKSAPRWKRADILVFNTGHWWTHGKTARGKNYYKEGDFIYPQFDAIEAYRRAMRTWGRWIDRNIDPAKKLVFYRGYSNAHFRGGDWDSGGSCNGEKEPIFKGAYLDSYPPKMKIVEDVIRTMRVPVILLNVTRLTNFRKDGHPSIYGKVRTEGQKISTRRQDCSHWCLPGVPDAWNELIYVSLMLQQTTSLNQK